MGLRFKRFYRSVGATALLVVFFAGTASSQEAAGTNPFEDDNARELILRYTTSRRANYDSGDHLQGLLTNRHRVGLLIPRQWNWRYRTLYHKELAAIADFSDEDPKAPIILGKTRGAPLIGDDLIDNSALWTHIGFDPERDSPAVLGLIAFSLSNIVRDVPIRRTGHIYAFDLEWEDPLGRDGLDTYTFRTGKPLTTADDPPRELITIEVRSRDGVEDQLVGGIWFDPDTRQPVRAAYRPQGRWELRAGFRGFVRAVPLVPRNAQGQVDMLAIDYEVIEDIGVAVPVRAALHGNMYWFFDQAILPVTIAWDLDWDEHYDSPRIKAALEVSGGGVAPDSAGVFHVPPHRDFGATDLVPEPIQAGWGFETPRSDYHPYARVLDELSGRPPPQKLSRTFTNALGGVRFNQVQGVNFKLRYPWYTGPQSTLDFVLVLGTSDFDPVGHIEFEQRFAPAKRIISAFAELRDANWMEAVNGFFSSIQAILGGFDDGNYYRASGFSVGYEVRDNPVSFQAELFFERQTQADKTEDYSLFGPPDDLPPQLDVDEGIFTGVRAAMNVQFGDDPQQGVWVARVFGSGAGGESVYGTVGASVDHVRPLFWRLACAARLTIGQGFGQVPAQSLWYLGGSKTVRGYPANSASDEAAYVLNAELGTSLPLARIVLFTDVGWADETGRLLREEPLWAVGLGLSLFDGVVRLDLAKGITRNGTWRFHFMTSGLF